MAQRRKRSRDRDKIATLIRIFRSAVTSGDRALRDATAAELAEYGIDLGGTVPPPADTDDRTNA